MHGVPSIFSTVALLGWSLPSPTLPYPPPLDRVWGYCFASSESSQAWNPGYWRKGPISPTLPCVPSFRKCFLHFSWVPDPGC